MENLAAPYEFRTVNVEDIAEFPTELGSRCLLLQHLGLDAYYNTEEEILDALTRSAGDPEYMKICLESSRCHAFWDKFEKGITPYNDKDPIRLTEHEGKYWVCEGKHRVCMAKRAGIRSVEAFVYAAKYDMCSTLPPKGQPMRYSFRHSFYKGNPRMARGSIAVLWVDAPHGAPPSPFAYFATALDAKWDTQGISVEVIPGLDYSVYRKEHGGNFILTRQIIDVETEVVIRPNHLNTKIWF